MQEPVEATSDDGTIDDGNGVRLGRVDIAIKGADAIRRTITLDGGQRFLGLERDLQFL